MYDRCLNCGGDGGSCVLTKRSYTKNYRVYGKKKNVIHFLYMLWIDIGDNDVLFSK